jgi:DNA-binding CsgD family transcriptional regulator
MEQFNRLSKREWEVLTLLLQGKSNKLIASSLGISKRTVEFHLKNIYAKFEVNSRIELILKLGNTTGIGEIEKLGQTTVDAMGEIAENRDRLIIRMGWATVSRDTVSTIGKESEMKNNWKTPRLLEQVLIVLCIGLLGIMSMASFIVRIQREFFVSSLSQSQIIEKAIQHSPATATGEVTSTTARQTTLGQASGISCNFLGRFILSLPYAIGLDTINLCDPNSSVWFVELRGIFHYPPGTANYVEVVLDPQGNFIEANSGPIQP